MGRLWLDSMILKVFSSLSDSMILSLRVFTQWASIALNCCAFSEGSRSYFSIRGGK